MNAAFIVFPNEDLSVAPVSDANRDAEGRPMSDYQLNSVTTPVPISQVRAVEPPRPPRPTPEHAPVVSSHGPAVVLGGVFAKPPERHGGALPVPRPAPAPVHVSADAKATGQRINHVI